MHQPIYALEFVDRTTIKPDLMADPDRLYSHLAQTSLKVYLEAQYRHYDGFGVSAVFPVFDSEGNAKVLSASNYRPDPQTAPADIRVCSELALDSVIREGDVSTGTLWIRGPKPRPERPIEGCLPGMRTLHLCRPCRGRWLTSVGTGLLVIGFNDYDTEPAEAMTLGEMLGFHDLGMEYPKLPAGKSAREIALEALQFNLDRLMPLTKTPNLRRVIKPSERD